VLGKLLSEAPTLGEPPVEPAHRSSVQETSKAGTQQPVGRIIECPDCEQSLSIQPELVGQEVACPHCNGRFTTQAIAEAPRTVDETPVGASIESSQKYCHDCGSVIKARAVICPKCGISQPRRDDYTDVDYEDEYSGAGSNRIAAGIFAILLGPLGIHKFILGYTTAGIIMLLVSILGTCLYGLGPAVMWVIGLVEGIIYLSKSDREFHRIYVRNKRPWF
jgi:TM2 domain-containing membrane protein YozV